jgi:hypothetical protein
LQDQKAAIIIEYAQAVDGLCGELQLKIYARSARASPMIRLIKRQFLSTIFSLVGRYR